METKLSKKKCEMFAGKNSMINISANFSSKCEKICECGQDENMALLYKCYSYNIKTQEMTLGKIFDGNLKQQIAVYNKFALNLKTRSLK